MSSLGKAVDKGTDGTPGLTRRCSATIGSKLSYSIIQGASESWNQIRVTFHSYRHRGFLHILVQASHHSCRFVNLQSFRIEVPLPGLGDRRQVKFVLGLTGDGNRRGVEFEVGK